MRTSRNQSAALLILASGAIVAMSVPFCLGMVFDGHSCHLLSCLLRKVIGVHAFSRYGETAASRPAWPGAVARICRCECSRWRDTGNGLAAVKLIAGPGTLNERRNARRAAGRCCDGVRGFCPACPVRRDKDRSSARRNATLPQWTLQPIAALLAEEATEKLGGTVTIDVQRPLHAFDARAGKPGSCRRQCAADRAARDPRRSRALISFGRAELSVCDEA